MAGISLDKPRKASAIDPAASYRLRSPLGTRRPASMMAWSMCRSPKITNRLRHCYEIDWMYRSTYAFVFEAQNVVFASWARQRLRTSSAWASPCKRALPHKVHERLNHRCELSSLFPKEGDPSLAKLWLKRPCRQAAD